MYEDKTIICADCQQEFVHSAEDQQRYAERGFVNEPKRCRSCREKRKTEAGEKAKTRSEQPDIGNSVSDAPRPAPARSGGGGYGERRPQRSFGGGGGGAPRGRGGFGDRGGRPGGGGPRELHPATCSQCGKQTEVPFKPISGRPVFCRDCYRSRKGE